MNTASPGRRSARTRLEALSPLLIVVVLAGALTLLGVGGALFVAPPEAGQRNVADLPEKEKIPARKRVFFDFLRPVVRAENERVLEQRRHLKTLLERAGNGDLSRGDRQWLERMARRYRVDAEEPAAQARALLDRVDVIPVSLALAQAALESAWGQSRFAREANNLFGEWCFEPGCGVVPKRRPAGKTYEVEAFDGVGASVRSYVHNLNSHPAYAELRRIRAGLREQGREPDGYAMAAGLTRYAAIGERYVEHIRGVIERNHLRADAG